MTRIIVCGGRNYRNASRVAAVMARAKLKLGLSAIIQGGADGADRLAAEWGWDNGVSVATFNADWKTHKKAAGPIRNARMIKEGGAEIVIAFPGGAGTADMVKQAESAGLRVIKIDW